MPPLAWNLHRNTKRRVVSSFTDLQTAEWAISKVIQDNAARITTWAQSHTGSIRLELTGDAGRQVGYGVIRKTGEMVNLSKVHMFLIRKEYNGMPYYVLTAYLMP
ncbi:RNase A-like domain-containing protein [Paraburkholderia sp. 35.1]|uniref:RNase A-like domain-containing protein n=1 Tax=unclassified Paraburkholderia TaxID=2615204 RepID=UPI003D241670